MEAWMPLVKDIAGSVGRLIGVIIIGWLVQQEALTPEQAASALTAFVATFVASAPVVGWAVYRTFKKRQKIVTALALPAGKSEAALEREMAVGKTASTLTPAELAPRIQV